MSSYIIAFSSESKVRILVWAWSSLNIHQAITVVACAHRIAYRWDCLYRSTQEWDFSEDRFWRARTLSHKYNHSLYQKNCELMMAVSAAVTIDDNRLIVLLSNTLLPVINLAPFSGLFTTYQWQMSDEHVCHDDRSPSSSLHSSLNTAMWRL